MRDLISRRELEDSMFREQELFKKNGTIPTFLTALSVLRHQPPAQRWIPVEERLPEEHDSIFKKVKGTDKWHSGMFENISDDVNVTVEFEDGTRKTKTSHTVDGNWSCEKDYGVKMKVIAWMPLPEAYKGE